MRCMRWKNSTANRNSWCSSEVNLFSKSRMSQIIALLYLASSEYTKIMELWSRCRMQRSPLWLPSIQLDYFECLLLHLAAMWESTLTHSWDLRSMIISFKSCNILDVLSLHRQSICRHAKTPWLCQFRSLNSMELQQEQKEPNLFQRWLFHYIASRFKTQNNSSAAARRSSYLNQSLPSPIWAYSQDPCSSSYLQSCRFEKLFLQ